MANNKNVKKEKNIGVVTKDTLGLGERAHAITERKKNEQDHEINKHKLEKQDGLDKKYEEDHKIVPYVVKTAMNNWTHRKK